MNMTTQLSRFKCRSIDKEDKKYIKSVQQVVLGLPNLEKAYRLVSEPVEKKQKSIFKAIVVLQELLRDAK